MAEEDPQMDMRMALNAQILAQGKDLRSSAAATGATTPVTAKSPKRVANSSVTEWNMGTSTGSGEDGVGDLSSQLAEYWPSHLPRPPSMKKLDPDEVDAEKKSNVPRVIVFNANTQEGSSLVRVLSSQGLKVIAVVRVVTSRNAKKLTRLKGVSVRVADLNNSNAVKAAAQGCQQAFLVTKYWERFENTIEEDMAKVVLDASAQAGIQRLVLATFEDTHELRMRGRKSQLRPTVDGLIYPHFEGMDAICKMGKQLGVQITHMMTSYFDQEGTKKSLILIRGENGRIVTKSHAEETKN